MSIPQSHAGVTAGPEQFETLRKKARYFAALAEAAADPREERNRKPVSAELAKTYASVAQAIAATAELYRYDA